MPRKSRRRSARAPHHDSAAEERSARRSSYEAKRDLDSSTEPSASADAEGGGAGPLIFVVQKHAAHRLHYDLRLELGNLLKSWALPKGPSLDPSERRLAVMVEDHPLSYASFEGVIPSGEYGAGADIVWDNGTYAPDDEGTLEFSDRAEAERRVAAGLDAGKLSIRLRGRKLKGSWALIRTSQNEQSWLLLKHRDSAAYERDILADEASILSNFTIDDLQSGRAPNDSEAFAIPTPAQLPGARRRPMPRSPHPMLATTATPPTREAGWLVEPKLDGIRVVACLQDGAARLLSRNGSDLTTQYPATAAAVAKQPANSLIVDGELVAPDSRGIPSLSLLQRRMNLAGEFNATMADDRIPVVYFVFDVLYVDSFDVRRIPLWQQRELLMRTIDPALEIAVLERFDAPANQVYEALVARGYEGVVAKRLNSLYVAGERSDSWRKRKSERTDEFVVVGYTDGSGSRASSFGALVLGQRDQQGTFVYAGRVGTGFRANQLDLIRDRMNTLAEEANVFAKTSPDVPLHTPVRPALVVEV